ncbi:MAG: Na/Pi cotransporter family protein [Flavobacteriales bacterium]|nr:Na/Pi cotransporter family protein [Flavobacteriales bacterium]
MEVGGEVHLLRIVLLVLTGLAVFLHAVDRLSGTLESMAGGVLHAWLKRYTTHVLSALLVGTVVTMLLDSSSAVIILTIVLVNSGMMTFRNALGVVMGANIGTTLSSQIIAFDIGEWSAVPLLLGLVLEHFGRGANWKRIGAAIFAFGLLFTGLFLMGYAVEPLKEHPRFIAWLHGLEHPLKGAAVGGLITLVIQSSSATVAMAITLATKGILSLPAGIAVMLGAELGTCSDTLLATVRCRRQAIKVGLFHLGFNLVSIMIGILLVHPFTALVVWISGNADVARSIANAHMLFNMLGVLLFLPFTTLIARWFDAWLPERVAAEPTALEEALV